MTFYARLTRTSTQLLGVFLFALFATACGEIDPDETVDTEDGIETTTQELNGINTYCGYSCPPSETFVGRTCDRGCSDFGECFRDEPPALNTSNAVMCRPRPTGTASISGSPSRVRILPGRLGNSRICWRTQNMPRGSTAWIKVVHDNNPEQLFASTMMMPIELIDRGWNV